MFVFSATLLLLQPYIPTWDDKGLFYCILFYSILFYVLGWLTCLTLKCAHFNCSQTKGMFGLGWGQQRRRVCVCVWCACVCVCGGRGWSWTAARSQGFIPESIDLQTLAQQDVGTKIDTTHLSVWSQSWLAIMKVNKLNTARCLI